MSKSFCLLCCCFSLWLLAWSARAESPLQIVTGEWRPYTSAGLRHGGVVNHIVAEAFALEGFATDFVFQPWKRGRLEARAGAWDAASVWSQVEGRERFFYYSDVVLEGRLGFAHRGETRFPRLAQPNIYADDFDPAPLADLQIAGIRGDDYGALADAAQAGQARLLYVNSAEQAVKMLLRRRVDAIIISPERLELYQQSTALNELYDAGRIADLRMHDQSIRASRYYLLFPRLVAASERRLAAFNRGLAELKASGRLAALLLANDRGEYRR